MPNPVLDRLREQREEQTTFIEHLLGQVAEQKRDLVDAERANLESARERVAQIDAQIKPLEEWENIRGAHTASTARFTPTHVEDDDTDEGETRSVRRGAGARIKTQPRTHEYRTAGEFLVDKLRAVGNPDAAGKGYLAPDPEAAQRMAAYAETRALVHQTTADTPGLLPENITGDIYNDLDPSRPLIASIGAKAGGMSPGKKFYRPVVTQHTQVGRQTAEKAELPSRQLKIDNVEFNKDTFGGALNVSRQDIDWTSPSAWDAIIKDLMDQYGVFTEDFAAGEFDTLVTAEVELITDDLDGWIAAIYEAAAHAMTKNKTVRASALRMPNHVWTSVDMWGKFGVMLAKWRAQGDGSGAGTSAANSFNGSILEFSRTMVPGLPDGTVIIGRKNAVEYYEERIGLLQAVQPSVLGIEVAYGGYGAFGTLDASAFVKIVNDVP